MGKTSQTTAATEALHEVLPSAGEASTAAASPPRIPSRQTVYNRVYRGWSRERAETEPVTGTGFRIEMTGQRCGYLEVLGAWKSSGKGLFWLTRCDDCGRESWKWGCSLRAGTAGCQCHVKGGGPWKYKPGVRVRGVTLLYPAEPHICPGGEKIKRWVCMCRCGRLLTYFTAHFTQPRWPGMCRHCSKARRQLPRGRMEHVESGTLDPEQSMMEREAHEFMSRSLESLVAKRPRYAQVVDRMYGLEDGEERTLQVVGDEWSLTRERIRQMQERALALLKKGMVIQGWNRDEATL